MAEAALWKADVEALSAAGFVRYFFGIGCDAMKSTHTHSLLFKDKIQAAE